MRFYYHDNKSDDCRLPHNLGEEAVSSDHVSSLGVLFYTYPPSSPESKAKVDGLAMSRNYANRDDITISPQSLGAQYEEKLKDFYNEHIHEDEEIRYILDGTGYFDVRDVEDRWVRIQAGPGDLLILPAGIYHRFTVDEKNYCRATRLFQDLPKWTALYRSEEVDEHQVRKKYVLDRTKGFLKQGALDMDVGFKRR